MAEGWVKLHRSITENWIWDNPQYLKWWLDLILMANHKEKKILFNGSFKKVDVGERITSEQKLAERWGVSRNTVRKFLSLLVEDDMISIEKSRKNGTTYKVNNYAIYQGFSEEKKQQTEQRAEHQKDNELNINKNEKNEKNEKNNKTSSSQPRKKRVYDTDSVYYILAEELFKQICQNQEIKQPNLQSWADDIRKMIEIDKRTENQVRGMIEWSQKHAFWSTNILSARKLREKYDTMAAQANRDYKTKQTKTLEYEKFSTDELPI